MRVDALACAQNHSLREIHALLIQILAALQDEKQPARDEIEPRLAPDIVGLSREPWADLMKIEAEGGLEQREPLAEALAAGLFGGRH